MSLLVKGGTIVTATDQYNGDVFIDGEKISAIGTALTMPAERVIDASGKYVLPGGIDVHTHLDMPFGGTTSADDFESGTRAAAHGGTTTIIDFAIQQKGQSTLAALDTWHKKAEGKTAIDYAFHMIITDMMDDHEIADVLTATSQIENRTAELIQSANANGGMDNITVALIQIAEVPKKSGIVAKLRG